MPKAICAIEGCEKFAVSRGWCGTHYSRWRRHGDPLANPRHLRGIAGHPLQCLVEGCDRARYGHGWCQLHYQRWKRNGDPTKLIRDYGSGRTFTSDGYVGIWEPDHPLANKTGYVLEHRKVVYDAGIEVPPSSIVHHKNGDKRDNRLANLTVMDWDEHTAAHVADGVTNQYGRWARRSPL